MAKRFDPVTGVMNRDGILGRLRREMSRAGREGRPLGAGLVDVDGFRDLVGRGGTRRGESALAWVAGRIRSVLRDYDSVGRIGVDEFLVVAPGVGRDDLETLAGRIRGAVGGNPAGSDGGVRVDVSIGAVAYRGGYSSEKLLSALQAALVRDRSRPGAVEEG